MELIKQYETDNENKGYNTNCAERASAGAKNKKNYYKIRQEKEGKTVRVHSYSYYCIELDKVYKSTCEIQKELGIAPSSVLKAIKGKLQSAGKHPVTREKLHWKFIEN